MEKKIETLKDLKIFIDSLSEEQLQQPAIIWGENMNKSKFNGWW